MDIAFPLRFDPRGRTAEATREEHVRQMIEQLLLTRPGERMMRPDFGSGLYHAVFAPNAPELATALEYATRASLQRYLGDVIDVIRLEIRAQGEILSVALDYVLRENGAPQSAVIPIAEPVS